MTILSKFLSPIAFESPHFISDVTFWHGHIPFAFWCMEALQPAVFVELGAHKGDSYFAFCQAIAKLSFSCATYAVDTWQGDLHIGHYNDTVYLDLQKYHDQHYKKFSHLMRMEFAQAVNHFTDASIDLLHIDGCHTYAAVKEDFQTWLPKLSDRGVVLFHDINVRRENFGVWQFWEEITKHYPHFSFFHSHGLGVLAVGNNIPVVIKELVSCNDTEATMLRTIFSNLGERISLQSTSSMEIQKLQNEIAKLHNSLSWKITKPLRWLRQ